ncbi:FAD-dependent monooxygenase [Halomonas sp. M20]|uniref:FAD-dependent monooxygenase n=1 Tax=Halomonas sp. M20 TaxID=2763264 RepID=UPI001D09D424|nr:FAD-dependent monooxygenase [Halomonas sp. M20]
MMTVPSETEILIVGAGPTGLTLAAELGRRGIDAVTVDKAAEGANTSRAAVVHARTLEVLEPLGVVSQMLEEGVKVPIFRIRDRDKVLITVDFREIPSEYAFALMCPQDRTEAILLSRLQALGGNILRPAEVTGADINENGAHVQIKAYDSIHEISARWVIGCDGMHSKIREAAGIDFKGATYNEGFVLADVHMDWPLDHEEVSLFFSPDGLVVVAPLPQNRYRIVATAEDASEKPSVPYMQALLDARGPKAKPARILDSVWSGHFKVHHRVAQNLRKGRVLLCGDAAHVHSPAGGQGMNTGIQDAVALAEVLADVVSGSDAARLDTWAVDRHKIAERVVALTDRATKVATLRSSVGQRLRNVAISFAGHIPSFTQNLGRTIAELENRSKDKKTRKGSNP